MMSDQSSQVQISERLKERTTSACSHRPSIFSLPLLLLSLSSSQSTIQIDDAPPESKREGGKDEAERGEKCRTTTQFLARFHPNINVILLLFIHSS